MKILIAYYSRTGGTEGLAVALKKEFETRGHTVDVEKVKPIKEHSFWGWWHIRMVKGECEIYPPKIWDVSKYDAICVGSPNWTRLSLPMAKYLRKIEGLKYKKIGFFATTAAPPTFEWYILSAYLLDLTFTRIMEQKRGRIIESILLSSFFKRWHFTSEYGQKTIQNFCHKIETPIFSIKSYFLEKKETEDARFLVIVFSVLFLLFFIFQLVSSIIGNQIFSWNNFLSLLVICFFANFSIITIVLGKKVASWGKYLVGISLVSLFTFSILFSTLPLISSIILGYILIFIIISLFRDLKAVLFTGLVTLSGYGYLYSFYPQKEIFQPSLDVILIILSLGVVSFITQSLQKYFLNLLEAQEEIEIARGTLEIKVKARTMELEELTQGLEEQVKERTKELQVKVEELEKFNKLVVGRELKMVELKEEIAKLKKELESKGQE